MMRAHMEWRLSRPLIVRAWLMRAVSYLCAYALWCRGGVAFRLSGLAHRLYYSPSLMTLCVCKRGAGSGSLTASSEWRLFGARVITRSTPEKKKFSRACAPLESLTYRGLRASAEVQSRPAPMADTATEALLANRQSIIRTKRVVLPATLFKPQRKPYG